MLRNAALVTTAVLLCGFASSADAATHRRADLVVGKLSAPTSATAPGTLRVSVGETNQGKATAARSVTRFFLVPAGKPKKVTASSLKLVTVSHVAALRARRQVKATVLVALPATIRPGTYVLIACADRGGAVRESNEANNCRAATKATVIKAAPTTPARPAPTAAQAAPAAGAAPADPPQPTATPAPGAPAAEQQAVAMVSAVDGESTVAGINGATARLLDYLGIAVAGDTDATGAGPRRGSGRDASLGPLAGITQDPADLLGDGLDIQDRAAGVGRISLSELAQDLTVVSGSLAAVTTDSNGNPTSTYVSAYNGVPEDPLLLGAAGRFQQFLADALATARKYPTAPASASIFVLAQLARSQSPSIDLADPSSYDPDDLLLGGGDLLAFVSGVVQMAQAIIDNPQSGRAVAQLRGSSTPCSDVKNQLDQASQFAGQIWAYTGAKATGFIEGEYAKDLAGLLGSDPSAMSVGLAKLQSALSIVAKLDAVIELYRKAKVHISAAQSTVAAPGPTDPDVVDPVTATAGIDDAEWDDFKANDGQAKQAVSDCLSTLGFPTLTSVGDVGAAASSWRAEWDIKGGAGLQSSLSHNPDFVSSSPPQKQFHAVSSHQATSVFTPDVIHQNTAPLPTDQTVSQTDYVTVGVRTDPPVTASTLIGIVDGSSAADGTVIGDPFGLAAAVTEQLTRLYEGLNTLKANVPITVTHTIPADGTWTGDIQVQTHTHRESHDSSVENAYPQHTDVTDDMKVTSFVEVTGSADPSSCSTLGYACPAAATVIAGYQHLEHYDQDQNGFTVCDGNPSNFTTNTHSYFNLDTTARGNGGSELLPPPSGGPSGGLSIALARTDDGGAVTWDVSGDWQIGPGTSKADSTSDEAYARHGTNGTCQNNTSRSSTTSAVDPFQADPLEAKGTFPTSTTSLHIKWSGFVDPPTDHTRARIDLIYHGRPYWQDPTN